MASVGAVSHFDVNLPVLVGRVVHVLPNSMIGMSRHLFVQHSFLQQTYGPDHLMEVQHHFSTTLASGQGKCFALQSGSLPSRNGACSFP